MTELIFAIAYAPIYGVVSAMTALAGILWESPRPEVRSKQHLVLALVLIGSMLVVGGVVSYYVGHDSAVGLPLFVGYFCFVFGGIVGGEIEKACVRPGAKAPAKEPEKRRRRCLPKSDTR
jgi:hypothetical protein